VFSRYSDGLKSAVRVRLVHAQANRGLDKLWGPEHYNKFGPAISSSFLVGGEGWFAVMPLALDELFGRPHPGRDWDDVAMYWAYVLYLLGIEERLIPRTGDEMRKMVDYIFANAGLSSPYRVDVATALLNILEGFHPAMPNVILGALVNVVGYDQVKFMVKDTKWEDTTLRPAAMAYAAAAHSEAAAMRVRDKLPGAERAKIKRAAKGNPPMDLGAQAHHQLPRARETQRQDRLDAA
jgi:hypothetical protein